MKLNWQDIPDAAEWQLREELTGRLRNWEILAKEQPAPSREPKIFNFPITKFPNY
jgi:hypothetical protein